MGDTFDFLYFLFRSWMGIFHGVPYGGPWLAAIAFLALLWAIGHILKNLLGKN